MLLATILSGNKNQTPKYGEFIRYVNLGSQDSLVTISLLQSRLILAVYHDVKVHWKSVGAFSITYFYIVEVTAIIHGNMYCTSG